MKVVFVASEVFPLAKTGGLADVCGALPLVLEKLGAQVTIFMPKYRCVDDKKVTLKKVHAGLYKTVLGKNVDVYLIEHPEFFSRDGLYGDAVGDYPDNLERFQYFCEQVLIQLKQVGVQPDIIHCHDWQSSLIPIYLKSKFSQDVFFKKTKTVLTIHNLAFQGIFDPSKFPHLHLDKKYFSMNGLEYYGKVNFLKGGIFFSDLITTVSPQYAQEIVTPRFGCGLDGVIKGHKHPVVGILNGVDTQHWDPSTDTSIPMPYDTTNVSSNKPENKQTLQKNLKLKQDVKVPLFGFVGRLSHQKGIDLIVDALQMLKELNLQIVIQGFGDQQYRERLSSAAYRHPEKFAVNFDFSEELAHKVYAASDFFLMPSHFEPCGLSQMISMRYGTIPVAYKTGGLIDTINPITEKMEGNGFLFSQYDSQTFVKTIKTAMGVFHQKKVMEKLIRQAMACDFSWNNSAKVYLDTYKKCLSSD